MRTLSLAVLYPEIMNIYADRGNTIAMKKRCEWHGIELDVTGIAVGDDMEEDKYDLLFIGGGQDREQLLIAEDLLSKKEPLKMMADDGTAMLAICGGFQLFGESYEPKKSPVMEGVGIFDMKTVAGDKRMIGNVVLEVEIEGLMRTLVGFENHSGKTILGSGVKPLGKVIEGNGNNGSDNLEGAVYKNVIGTYLHGALLPKNPWLTDHLIRTALQRRYKEADLKELDDALEDKAHKAAIARAKATNKNPSFVARMFER